MSAIQTQLQPGSDAFAANAAALRAVVDDLQQTQARVAQGGSAAARAKHQARGKLLARERIDALLDPGSAFLEIAPLAALGMYADEVPCAGVVAGIGRVSGVECVIVANDAKVAAAATSNNSYTVIPNWYADTGATDHITHDLECLSTKERYVRLISGLVKHWPSH